MIMMKRIETYLEQKSTITTASIFALVSGYVSLPNILPIQFDSGNEYIETLLPLIRFI